MYGVKIRTTCILSRRHRETLTARRKKLESGTNTDTATYRASLFRKLLLIEVETQSQTRTVTAALHFRCRVLQVCLEILHSDTRICLCPEAHCSVVVSHLSDLVAVVEPRGSPDAVPESPVVFALGGLCVFRGKGGHRDRLVVCPRPAGELFKFPSPVFHGTSRRGLQVDTNCELSRVRRGVLEVWRPLCAVSNGHPLLPTMLFSV